MMGLVGAMCLMPGTATATSLTGPTCTSDSFSAYALLGNGGCQIGAVQVFNFDLYTIDAGGGLHAASQSLLDGVGVRPIWNSTTGFLELTIGAFGTYTGFTPYPVDASHTAGFQIRFAVDPPPILDGESAVIDPPFGTVAGTQFFCSNELFSASTGACASSATPGSTSFGFSSGVGTPASLTFSSPLFELDTRTNIILNPGLTTASGFDGVVFGIQTTEGVPEPTTSLLIAGGLFAVWLQRRRLTDLR